MELKKYCFICFVFYISSSKTTLHALYYMQKLFSEGGLGFAWVCLQYSVNQKFSKF